MSKYDRTCLAYQSGEVTPSSWLPKGDTLRPELEPDPVECLGDSSSGRFNKSYKTKQITRIWRAYIDQLSKGVRIRR